MCLADPLQSTTVEIDVSKLGDPTSFTAFLSTRCRAYVVSQDEADKPQVGYRHHGCNCYSSGETENSEGILLSAWPHMLAWLDILYKDRTYAEGVVGMGTDMDEELSQALEGLACKTRDGPELYSVTKPATAKPGTPNNDPQDEDVELEAKIEDGEQESIKGEDAMENTQDRVVEAEEPSMKTPISPASEKKIMHATTTAIYESDDGYSGDVEEVVRPHIQRSASVSETDSF